MNNNLEQPCCKKCKRRLTFDEIGIHKKMINRGAESFYCLTCLAEHIHTTEDVLLERIDHFRAQGCELFV